MRVAHLIMAHKEPAQVERLVKALLHDDADIYIHISTNSAIEPFEYLKLIDHVRLIQNRLDVRWGSYKFTKAIIESTREILQTGIAYDFINLISGQDYPIKPVDKIHKFLEAHIGRSFIYDEPEGSDWWSHAITRVEKYHTTNFEFKGQYRIQAFINWLLPKRKFPLPMELYGGSNSTWWTISIESAEYLVQFFDNHPELRRFAYFSWGSDEFLVATILMNSPYRDKMICHNYRYIDWSDGGAHPVILTTKDLAGIKASDCLFARKFDVQQDATILDRIDKEVLGLATYQDKMSA
ncbi:beta-1,6-N-acetylglucosaminyltransferase [Pontibacter sp. SGAir0037]|uniref:beta-1,6-N-acetylglucosaminyltransferase n=1 Tax=Pontibacter sp. SGAir0037 TaxID=2571030 RepID=UPI0010CCC3A3|nr:beta-1,6-N-acetylglucosaminyltransferase [Pontibacter sp. SGAir0037]QCR22499.1 glycosyltransferase [Pontibacter sp. SGAir0037]